MLCDNRGPVEYPTPGCDRTAATSFVCPVEGRDVDLCRFCEKNWRELARGNPDLSQRCPNCAHMSLIDRTPPTARQVVDVARYLNSPLARIVDNAMLKEGLLIDARRRVLLRLVSDPDFVSREDWSSLAGVRGG